MSSGLVSDQADAARQGSSPTPPPARVLVAVVTYNSQELLPELFESLDKGLEGLDWQLVVVDNASTDDSVGTTRRLRPGAVVVERDRNAGYAAGINAAVAAGGEHDAVLVLNPDVRLERGCVARLCRALERPGIGIAVPRLLDAQGRLIPSMRREPTVLRTLGDGVLGARRVGRSPRMGETVADRAAYDVEQLTDWAEGSTQLVSAACWAACGGWDESYFLYSEETEYDLRARDAGFGTLYVPEARATHLEGGSGTSPALWALLVVNQVRLYRRRHRLPATVAFWAVTLLREVIRSLLGRANSRAAVRTLLRPSMLRHPTGPDFLRSV